MMRKNLIIGIVSLLICYCNNIQGQSNNKEIASNLLKELETALYLNEKIYVNAADVLDCEVEKIDSSKSIKIRKKQADASKVLILLEQLAYTRDTNSIEILGDIYERQIKFFKKEWEKLYHDKYIEECQMAIDQYRILLAFEETWHSLKLEKMQLSDEEKYAYNKRLYRDYFDMNNYAGDAHVDTILAQLNIPFFSEYTKDIKKRRWWAYRLDFEYIMPYSEDVSEEFIKDLDQFRFPEEKGDRKHTFEEYYLLTNIPIIDKITNPKLEDLIINKFDYYSDHAIARLYRMAKYRNTPKLIHYLLDQLLHNPKVNHEKYTRIGRSYLFSNRLLSDVNQSIIEDYLLNAVELAEKGTPARSEMLFYLSEVKTNKVLTTMETWLMQPTFFTEAETKLATDVKNSIAYHLEMNKK